MGPRSIAGWLYLLKFWHHFPQSCRAVSDCEYPPRCGVGIRSTAMRDGLFLCSAAHQGKHCMSHTVRGWGGGGGGGGERGDKWGELLKCFLTFREKHVSVMKDSLILHLLIPLDYSYIPSTCLSSTPVRLSGYLNCPLDIKDTVTSINSCIQTSPTVWCLLTCKVIDSCHVSRELPWPH